MKKVLSLLFLISVITTGYAANNVRWALQNVPSGCTVFHDGMTVFHEHGLYGAIDRQGKIVIPAQYKSMKSFQGGLAIVETEEGVGIINKHNQFVLSPQANCKIETPLGDDKKIYKDIYILVHKDNQHKDIWYKNRFILKDIETKYISLDYPFVSWDNRETGIDYAVNINTGDFIEASSISFQKHDDFIEMSVRKDNTYSQYFYDCATGEPIKNCNISSRGYIVYKNQLLAPDSTLIYEGRCHQPIWQNDMVVFTNDSKYIGDGKFSKRDSLFVFSADGKLVAQTTLRNGSYSYTNPNKKGIIVSADIQKGGKEIDQWLLYDYKGNELISGDIITAVNSNWYCIWSNDNKNNFLYNIVSRKRVDLKPHTSPAKYEQDGVMIAENKQGRYVLCGLIGNYSYQLDASISYVCEFSEGVAVVEFKDEKHGLIDRTGNIILRDDENFLLHTFSTCSEGVIPALNKKTYEPGFIYSPLASNKYVYDKNANNDNLMDEGLALFEKKQYSRAKDSFYEIMVNDPTNVKAIINYASCLNNMGYYDSAIDAYITALQIEPNNTLAKESLQIAKNNKIAAQQNAAMQQQRNNNWFDGITTFLNILGQSFNQYSTFTNDLNASRSSAGSFNSHSSGSSCKGCNGTGNCSMCKGKGWYKNASNGKIYDCPSCHSSGRCGVCYGRGVIK